MYLGRFFDDRVGKDSATPSAESCSGTSVPSTEQSNRVSANSTACGANEI